MILSIIRSLFCRHRSTTFVRNLYGDEIISWGWKRSVWRCDRCGLLVGRDALHSPANAQTMDAARLERLARLAHGEVLYSDGPLPETGWDEAPKAAPDPKVPT